MADAPEIFTIDYYRKLAALERTHPWFTGTRLVAEAIIPSVLGSPAGGLRILDAGCGTGATVEWLRKFAGHRSVSGIDLAPAAVVLARGAGDIAAASATALPYADGAFDLVYCADVVQHLSDEDRAVALAEFRRVLRPGGGVLVRSNLATGAPAITGGGYESFDFRVFGNEMRAAGLELIHDGRIAVLSGLAAAFRKRDAGGGWKSRGLQIQPLRGLGKLLGIALTLGFMVEALAVSLRGQLPRSVGTSSLYFALKPVQFEQA